MIHNTGSLFRTWLSKYSRPKREILTKPILIDRKSTFYLQSLSKSKKSTKSSILRYKNPSCILSATKWWKLKGVLWKRFHMMSKKSWTKKEEKSKNKLTLLLKFSRKTNTIILFDPFILFLIYQFTKNIWKRRRYAKNHKWFLVHHGITLLIIFLKYIPAFSIGAISWLTV